MIAARTAAAAEVIGAMCKTATLDSYGFTNHAKARSEQVNGEGRGQW